MIINQGFSAFWILPLLFLYVQGHPTFNSHGELDVPFPPAFPTAENVGAICRYGNGRHRYLSNFFPYSGASHFRRRGDAINRLESWYALCCSDRVAREHTLCCAVQAWKLALSWFCTEEFSTMTVAYECCTESGDVRWACFNTEVANPFYRPTPGYSAPLIPPQPGFTFYSAVC